MTGSDSIGENIRRLRKQKRLYQNTLAGLCGLSACELCRIEKGRVRPAVDDLIKLAGALNVSLDELVGRNHVDK